MKSKPLFLVLTALLVLAGLLTACQQTPAPTPTQTPTATSSPSPFPITTTSTPAPKPIKLKLASPFPGPPATDSNWAVWWQEKVTKATNGRVTFENHWAGSLFAPGQMKDAVEQRFADVFQFFYGYAPSTLPLGNYQFAIPFRPTTPTVITKVHQQLWNEIPEFEKELASAKGKTLLFGPAANYDVLSRMPLKTLDDFKGKKIACVGLYFPEQVNGSGGVAISNAAGERYVQFQQGTIDAEVLVHNQIESWKHVEVAKYLTRVDLGALNAMSVVINTAAWGELPADVQAIMQKAADETEAEYAAYLDKLSKDLLTKWETKDGVTISVLSDADRAKWAGQMVDTAQTWADQMEAKGLPGKKIVNRFIELCQKEGHKFPLDFTVK